jgi:hypothetical protein
MTHTKTVTTKLRISCPLGFFEAEGTDTSWINKCRDMWQSAVVKLAKKNIAPTVREYRKSFLPRRVMRKIVLGDLYG